MSEAPKLPAQVSLDGHELWDWAARFSEHVHRQEKIRQLKSRLAVIGTRCGDCDLWMKSSQCPREHNVNGRSQGPSMNDCICGQFRKDADAEKRRSDLANNLDALTQGETNDQ